MPTELFLLNEAHFCRCVDYTNNVVSFYAFPVQESNTQAGK